MDPWKTPIGTPCSDSCGIFLLRKPGEYKLVIGIGSLHADDRTGFLATSPENADDPYERHGRSGGQGQPLKCYLPKHGINEEKIGPLLQPSAESSAAVACGRGQRRLRQSVCT